MIRSLLCAATLLSPIPLVALAQAPARDTTRARSVDTIRVTGRHDDLVGIARSASEGRVGIAELRIRPLNREGELLETVPGMIVTQHSGDGKANQYFVRGFNLDHGTDFQTRVEGMPVNMPSHAHGQGYTDLSFIIPELVDHVEYHLGVSHTKVGDFGSAGAAQFAFARQLAPFIAAGPGEHGLRRVAVGGSQRLGPGSLLLGGEAKTYDGPWVRPQDLRKLSGLARYSWDRGTSSYSLLGLAYNSRWNATDQIPRRAVESAAISRFGLIDETDGGDSQRFSLSGSWRGTGGTWLKDIQLFGIYSDLDLFSNFGYFLDDPANGDQFNQVERRFIAGGNASIARSVLAAGVTHTVTLGAQSRVDAIRGLGLHRSTARVRTGTVRTDRVVETGNGVYVEAESRWTEQFRSVVGIRADGYTFDVASDRVENSGSRSAAIASPKASLIWTPSAKTELYASGGFGFHSNDARGTTITVDPVSGDPAERVDPLVRSRGAEIGMRATPAGGVRSTVTLWMLKLDSELLFIGDGGATEASAASRRAGVTFANFYRSDAGFSVDADLSLASARFVGLASGDTHIPGAIESVAAAGAAWEPRSGVFAALRLRNFGAYPLIEDNSVRARPSTLVNADVGYHLASGARLRVTMLNVFDAKADDVQYFYTSRLRGEPVGGVDDVHFHPAEPRQLRASLEWRW